MIKQNSFLRNVQSGLGLLFAKIPISPNDWTILSLLIALFAAFNIASGNLFFGLSLFVLSALCDAIDGAVARARGETSKVGAFIDGISDRFVEFLFLFSFMFVSLPLIYLDAKIWISLAVFFGTMMPSFVRAYSDHKEVLSKKDANALGGLCERSERIILLVLGLLVSLLANTMNYFVYALILVIIFSIITILQRLFIILSKK